MKIIFIAPLPPPVTGHSLASKVFLDGLIKFHQVEIVNLSKDSFKEGVDSLKRIIEVVRILHDVWRKRKDAEVIYLTISESFSGNIKDILIYLICFKNLPRMVIHLHGGSIKKLIFDKSKLLFSINRFFIRRLWGAIVLGQSHVDIFSDVIEKKKIHIVPNFAEDYLFIGKKEIREKFKYTETLRILFLSNLTQGKGHNEIVDAYLALDDNLKKRVKIDFAGAFESDVDKVKFLNRTKGIKGIFYHGVVSGAEKRNLLTRSHLFCLPTCLNEGQPISILEAYASGCVVITTNQGGIRDVFRDRINGFEVQKNSANSIKLVIQQLIEKPEQLLPIAISNREIAHSKYRTSYYNASLLRIIKDIGSNQN